jgi:hypothetical protein
MIVGIYSSVPQSGKSLLATKFIEAGYKPLSFATPVKLSMAVVLNGLNVERGGDYLWGHKKDAVIPELGITGGQLLSTFASDYMRDTVDKDVWLNIAKNMIEPNTNYIIDDMRYPNEYEFIRNNGVVIHVTRDISKTHTRAKGSEGLLDEYFFDYNIKNNGTLEHLDTLASRIVMYCSQPKMISAR